MDEYITLTIDAKVIKSYLLMTENWINTIAPILARL